MRIQRVQADHYFIPLPTVLSDSTHGTIRGFELVTVRLHDAEGAVGVGYTYTVGTGGAAVHALVARDLAPLLAGREAERIEEIWQAMWWALLGAEFPLMVDANMRWSVDEAIRAARALREFDPVWLEEPTSPDDVPGHVRIVRDGGVPIAAGENLHTLHEFRHLIAAGGVTFPEPDVTNCGGVTTFMKVCHLAEAFSLPVTSHGAHDVTVHLLAAAPNRSYLEAHGFGLDRFIAEPLRLEAGAAVAPERSGHGIEFDWKALDAVRARSV